MTAASMPPSAFWVPEVWFEPRIRGCLRADMLTVLYVVVQNRRPAAVVDVVLDLFSVEMGDMHDRTHCQAPRFEIGRIGARDVFDVVHRLDPVTGARYVHEVKLFGCLRGRDVDTGEDIVEPVAFWSDEDAETYLHPAPVVLATSHSGWEAAGRRIGN